MMEMVENAAGVRSKRPVAAKRVVIPEHNAQ
jgi:hypothetical protein